MLSNGPSKIILKTQCDFCVQGWGLDVKGFYTSPRYPHFPAGDLFRVTSLKTAHGGPWARLTSPGTLRRESRKPHPNQWNQDSHSNQMACQRLIGSRSAKKSCFRTLETKGAVIVPCYHAWGSRGRQVCSIISMGISGKKQHWLATLLTRERKRCLCLALCSNFL